MEDIDLEGDENDQSTWWLPIGNKDSNCFSGIFEGNGHKIRNLYIKKTEESKENNRGMGFFCIIKYEIINNFEIIDGYVEVESGTYRDGSWKDTRN